MMFFNVGCFWFVVRVLFDIDDIWLFFGDCIGFFICWVGGCVFWFCFCWLFGVLIVEFDIFLFGFGDLGVDFFIGLK